MDDDMRLSVANTDLRTIKKAHPRARLGTSKVHALRLTFARAMEDAGDKVSEFQAALGHAADLARLHQGENRHLARLSGLYGLTGLDQHTGASTDTRTGTGITSSAWSPAQTPHTS